MKLKVGQKVRVLTQKELQAKFPHYADRIKNRQNIPTNPCFINAMYLTCGLTLIINHVYSNKYFNVISDNHCIYSLDFCMPISSLKYNTRSKTLKMNN